MKTTEFPHDTTLDLALIQCLRLFAQQGRKIRNHALPSKQSTSNAEETKQVRKDIKDKMTITFRTTNLGKVVE